MGNNKTRSLAEVVKIIEELEKYFNDGFLDEERRADKDHTTNCNIRRGFFKGVDYFKKIANKLTKDEVIEDIKLIENEISLKESKLTYSYIGHNTECRSENLLDILKIYQEKIDIQVEIHSNIYEEWKKQKEYEQFLENITCEEEVVCDLKFGAVDGRGTLTIEEDEK